ncbi:apolipoprotein N-acyltransferase [Alteromonas sp. 1036]
MTNGLVFLLGAILTFAFAPFNFWFLLYPVLVAWLVISIKCSKTPFWTSWWFGFGYFGAGISWVHVSIATFGGLPLVISILMMAILCGYLALFPALLVWACNKYIQIRLWPLILPFAWLIMEFCRAHFLTGFPWLSIAYSQIDSPLQGLFPIIGEIGVSAIIIWLVSSIALLISEKQIKQFLATLSAIALAIFFSNQLTWIKDTGQSKTITLVQGNIEQSIKWQPEHDKPTIEKYKKLTSDNWDSDLIVWPEAAIPVLESLPLGHTTLGELDAMAEEHNTAIITGAVDYNYKSKESYNFLIALGIDIQGKNSMPYYYQHQNRYAKHHLLPIGEFVPFEDILRPLAPMFNLPMSSFNRGDYVQPNLLANGLEIVPALCYEIAFPNQIRANITATSNLILTVSNDAWFGDSHGPHQHLQIARIRALEFGLPLVRATNTGVTGAYDANGKLLGKLAQFEADTLTVQVPLVEGLTFYRNYGNWPSMLFFGLLSAAAFALQYGRSKRPSTQDTEN